MSPELQTVVDFVEGRLDANAFEQMLVENPRFEEVLNNDPHLSHANNTWPSVFIYVLEQDLQSLWGRVVVEGALADFLTRNGTGHRPAKRYGELHELILQAQPPWLDASLDFVEKEMLPEASGLQGEALKIWLKKRFLQLFCYSQQPPDWIQGADWPINESGPLIFLGQLPHLRANAAVFVFLDSQTGECRTIVQMC